MAHQHLHNLDINGDDKHVKAHDEEGNVDVQVDDGIYTW